MSKGNKAQIIEHVEEAFGKSSIGILTDYRGLKAAEMGSLRRKLKESGIEYKVVKNTLARLAAERLGRSDLSGLFKGPVALALGYGDESQVPRVLDEYIRTSKSALSIRGGFLGNRSLTAKDVATLATLPSRDVLVSQVMAGLQSPIAALVSVLVAPIRGVEIALQARIKQLEGN